MEKSDKAAAKAELRRALRARARALDEAYRRESAAAICRRLTELDAYARAERVLAFFGTAAEIDTAAFLRAVLRSGRTLLLPRCEPGRRLALCVVRDLETDLAPGAYGIPEPSALCPACPPERVELAVVPCLSMDRAGRRLGQGGGYYDRLLPLLRCESVCVCRGALASARPLPAEAHDAPCSLYLTESEAWRPAGADVFPMTGADVFPITGGDVFPIK